MGNALLLCLPQRELTFSALRNSEKMISLVTRIYPRFSYQSLEVVKAGVTPLGYHERRIPGIMAKELIPITDP